MRRKHSPFFLLAALAVVAAHAGLGAPLAADSVDALLLQVGVESELLVEALERYRAARDAERSALARLAELSSAADGRLERRDLPPAELRRSEDELAAAAEIVAARLRRTAEARRQVYDLRRRLALLERRLADAGGGPLVPDSGVSGLWQIEIEPGGLFGLMRVQADGTLLSGTYVLSNGDQGSVRGTVVDDRVVLERIDATRGFIATLEGGLDSSRGSLEGAWTARDLTAGEPTTGTWTGRRLTTRARGATPSR